MLTPVRVISDGGHDDRWRGGAVVRWCGTNRPQIGLSLWGSGWIRGGAEGTAFELLTPGDPTAAAVMVAAYLGTL